MATLLPEKGSKTTLYIVDLSSYLLRAYHAIAPLSSPSGEPTHAVHGLVTMLERLMRDQSPVYMAIAMDSGRNTFRKEIYPAYKENRPPAPEDLRVQMARAEAIVRAFGLCVLKENGVEADDLIATLSAWAVQQSLDVVIVGADKDLMQLASERVVLYDTMRGKVFGPAEVTERFGVGPSQLGDLLALMGDASDNIPGVPSVGPKTAAKLIEEYGSLEGVLGHANEISGKKLREVVTTHTEAARLSRRLVALKTDCSLSLELADLRLGLGRERDDEAIVRLYEELGFTRQLAVVRAGNAPWQVNASTALPVPPKPVPIPPVEVPLELFFSDGADAPDARSLLPSAIVVATTVQEIEEWIRGVLGEELTFELLTTTPERHAGPLVGLGLFDGSRVLYVPLAHRYLGAPNSLDWAQIAPLFEVLPEQIGTVTFDLKRQLVLAATGASSRLFRADDALLAAYIVDPERRHGMDSLATAVDIVLAPFEQISKEGRVKRDLDELEVSTVSAWVDVRLRVISSAMAKSREQLDELGLQSLYSQVELPIAHQLAEMQTLGVLIEGSVLRGLGKDCDEELVRLERDARRLAGSEFNVNSPRQLETILFDELGLKPLKRTKTARSTDAQTLEALSEEHELPGVILEYRQISKLKGTYIDALPNLIEPRTGRVHGSWEQAIAATGRISSVDPNLQNIPIRSALGRKIRAAFVAPPGYRLVSADYSQIELRIMAHLSEDERLIEAFQRGQDVHLRTAMEVFGVSETEVTREMRARAKAVNFGVLYGQGESGLSKALKIERKVAADFIAAYFAKYQGVRRFLDETLAGARQGGVVQSMLGRRRLVPDIVSGNRARRLAAERVATNLPIQGSAADILKLAMLEFQKPVTPGARLVLTVHDELVFEVPEAEVQDAKGLIAERMSRVRELRVPLVVSVGEGLDWNSAH